MSFSTNCQSISIIFFFQPLFFIKCGQQIFKFKFQDFPGLFEQKSLFLNDQKHFSHD